MPAVGARDFGIRAVEIRSSGVLNARQLAAGHPLPKRPRLAPLPALLARRLRLCYDHQFALRRRGFGSALPSDSLTLPRIIAMPDPYALCPAGTGKKLKFCCSDLMGELDKIDRMLEADQRLACLEHIERLESKYPDRACLLTHKARLQGELGQVEAAQNTVERTLAKFPGNTVALAESAVLQAAQHGAKQGLAVLHQALETCGDAVPWQLYDAIGGIVQLLVAEGNLLAARGHLILQHQLNGENDSEPLALLARLTTSPNMPLLFREELQLGLCPEKAPWESKFNEAIHELGHGHWAKAARLFETLSAHAPDAPAVWRNLAILRSYLADNDGAAAAWRTLATLDVSLDEAVEAEALAQLLDTSAEVDTVEVFNCNYPIADIDRLQERLLADKRAESIVVEAHNFEEGQPPPRSAFLISDRALPASGSNLALEDASKVLGVAYVFGRQTDREARLELIAQQPRQAACSEVLEQIAGDSLGPRGEAVVQRKLPALARAMEFNYRLPPDISAADFRRLRREHEQRVLTEQWPNMPSALLGGQTPRAAAADPKNHIKLHAMILVIETALAADRNDFDFDALRRDLGLPALKSIDPWQSKPADIRTWQFPRVDVSKLTDEDLVNLFTRAVRYRAALSVLAFGQELVERSSLEESVDKSAVYGEMARVSPDADEALGLVTKAREAAQAKGQSPAHWLIEELAIQVGRDSREAERLLDLLVKNHINEPGVRGRLTRLLQAIGAIDANGVPATRHQAEVAPAAPAGELWTPESAAAPAAAGGSGGSKLWLPGME